MAYTAKTEAEKATLEFIEKNEITIDNVTNHDKLDLILQHVIDCGTKSGVLPNKKNKAIYDYKFKMNNRFRTMLGRCTYDDKLIELSTYYLEHGSLVHVVQTLLHEFCHHTTYQLVGKGYRDGDNTFESLIKSCNSKSTRTTEIDFPRHAYKADCGCVFTRHVKRDYSGFVCGEHKGSDIHYVGYLTTKEIEELRNNS